MMASHVHNTDRVAIAVGLFSMILFSPVPAPLLKPYKVWTKEEKTKYHRNRHPDVQEVVINKFLDNPNLQEVPDDWDENQLGQFNRLVRVSHIKDHDDNQPSGDAGDLDDIQPYGDAGDLDD
jgi:hypothetical protein